MRRKIAGIFWERKQEPYRHWLSEIGEIFCAFPDSGTMREYSFTGEEGSDYDDFRCCCKTLGEVEEYLIEAINVRMPKYRAEKARFKKYVEDNGGNYRER